MGNIVLLDENTINQIAAGEVVDRPASIVKELVENSIDAGATNIRVEIKNGGISYISITDNGSGIRKDDVELAFERHATSKIRKEKDISNITSMGFRGEALASIAGIAKVTLVTKHREEDIGSKIVIEGGNVKLLTEAAYNTGTNITVQNIFYNVPARYKFLKKDYTEAGYIEDVITRIALANPKVGFRYINNGKEIIRTNEGSDLTTVIYSIFGRDTASKCLSVNFSYEDIEVSGVIAMPSLSRSTRQHEFTYINKRYVKNKVMEKAIEDGFEQTLSIGKFPFSVINAEIKPNEVDVNVHPAKLEVKFQDESKIFKAIFFAVKNRIKEYEREISPFSTNAKEYVENVNNSRNIFENSAKHGGEMTLKKSNDEISYTNNGGTYNVAGIMENTEGISNQYTQSDFGRVNSVDDVKRENNENIENVSTNEIEISQEIFEIQQLDIEVPKGREQIQYKYIGNVFNTYIIIEIKDRMYIIDQHAAHERLLYERIKENYYGKDRQTQMLLVPILVELKNLEKEIVMKNKEMFEKTGFVIEDFGDNAIKICGIPNVGYDIDSKDMFIDGIDEIMGASKTQKEEKEKRFLATLACKSAIKGNMSVTREEQVALLDEMMKLENPFTCPHGRPTAYELSKYDIERRFLRK